MKMHGLANFELFTFIFLFIFILWWDFFWTNESSL